MSESNERVLAKIKKLLNLASKTSNAGEAANALSQAQKLMHKHNLSEADISLADIGQAASKLAQKKPPEWVVNLLTTINQAFGCEGILQSSFCPKTLKLLRHVVFIGVKPNPEIAKYTFDVLHRQLSKARTEYIKVNGKRCKPATKTARGDAFAEHWVYAVYQKIQALVVNDHDKALIAQFKNEKVLQNRETKEYQAKSRAGESSKYNDARSAGYREGKKATLNSPVAGSETAKLEHHA